MPEQPSRVRGGTQGGMVSALGLPTGQNVSHQRSIPSQVRGVTFVEDGG